MAAKLLGIDLMTTKSRADEIYGAAARSAKIVASTHVPAPEVDNDGFHY